MRLSNTLIGILKSKWVGKPFYLRYQVTGACNYRCRMCGQRKEGVPVLPELDLEQIAVVAGRAASLGARHLVLTGGEPFLRKDLPGIIALFKQHGFSIRIQTNGGPQVTEPLFLACVQSGLDDISVSIDTLNEALQDSICRAPRVVENALRVLHMARKYLPHSMSQANIVASAYNFTELPDLVRFFYNQGIYTYITPVMLAPQEVREDHEYHFRAAHQEAFKPDGLYPDGGAAVIGQLLELRRQGMGLTNSERFIRDYGEYLATGSNPWVCDAGTFTLDIASDGSVSVCKEKTPFGNILADDFLTLYRSEESRQYRHQQIFACSGCFYGEYREPSYAIHSAGVLWEWGRGWSRTFRRGMRFKTTGPRTHVKTNPSTLNQVP